MKRALAFLVLLAAAPAWGSTPSSGSYFGLVEPNQAVNDFGVVGTDINMNGFRVYNNAELVMNAETGQGVIHIQDEGVTYPVIAGVDFSLFSYNETNHSVGFICADGGTSTVYLGDFTDYDEGYLAYDTTAQELRIATAAAERFVFTAAGELGVGTLSPAYALDVSGDVNLTGAFRIDGDDVISRSAGDLRVGFGLAGSDIDVFAEELRLYGGGGTQAITVDSFGFVGIRETSTLEEQLHVQGDVLVERATTTTEMRVRTNQNNTGGATLVLEKGRGNLDTATDTNIGDNLGTLEFRGYASSNYRAAARITASQTGTPSGIFIPGQLDFLTTPAAGVPTSRITILSSGEVGIGDTAPTYQLDVTGDINSTATLRLEDLEVLDLDTADLEIGQGVTGQIEFYTGSGSLGMTLDSAGDLGLGAATAPDYMLTVEATDGDGIMVRDSSGTSAGPTIRVIGERNDSNGSQSFGGKLALAGNRADASVSNGKKLGTVYFGGNHTAGGEGTILYPASISGVAEGTFNSSTDMPTGIAFYTGSTGRDPITANVTAGTEAMRITNDGKVGIGASAPEDTVEINDSGSAKIMIHSTTSGNEAAIEVGEGGSGNRVAYVDFVGDATYTDFGMRLIRYGNGANTNGELIHRGTGNFNIFVADGGTFRVLRSGSAVTIRADNNGDVCLNCDSATADLDINGGRVRIRSSDAPATSSTSCSAGEMAWNTNYIFVCTASNTWKRATLNTF